MTDTMPPPGWKINSPSADRIRKDMSERFLKSNVNWNDMLNYVGMLSDSIIEMRAEIRTLQDRPSLKYAGVWKQDKVFGAGNFVTDGGSMWHAERATVGERPGSGDAWTLIVKKGKDAR